MSKTTRDSNGTTYTQSTGGGVTYVKPVNKPRTVHTTDWVNRNLKK